MKPSILFFVSIFVLLNSCKSGEADKEAITALKNNMETTTRLLGMEKELKVNEMRSRLNSPYTGIKTRIWFPKVLVIDSVTSIFIKVIEFTDQDEIKQKNE